MHAPSLSPFGAYTKDCVDLNDHGTADIRAPGQVLEQLPGGAVMEYSPRHQKSDKNGRMDSNDIKANV